MKRREKRAILKAARLILDQGNNDLAMDIARHVALVEMNVDPRTKKAEED